MVDLEDVFTANGTEKVKNVVNDLLNELTLLTQLERMGVINGKQYNEIKENRAARAREQLGLSNGEG